jgi:hypothetical protein
MASSRRLARKKTTTKTNRKWKERISGTTSVVNLIYITLAAIIAAAAITAGVIHFFFPAHQSPAQLTAEIEQATVQQNVTWADYLAETNPTGTNPTGNIPSPPSSGTPGILVQIEAKLSGYEYHIYSGDVTLFNPKTQVELTDTTFRGDANICTQAVPSAQQYSFILECWIGEPMAGQTFLVRSRIYYTGLSVTNGPFGFVPVDAQFLAVLDTGVFTSTGG